MRGWGPMTSNPLLPPARRGGGAAAPSPSPKAAGCGDTNERPGTSPMPNIYSFGSPMLPGTYTGSPTGSVIEPARLRQVFTPGSASMTDLFGFASLVGDEVRTYGARASACVTRLLG